MDKQQALRELKELQARATALEEIINAPEAPAVFAGVLLEPPSGAFDYYFLTTKGRVQNSRTGSGNTLKEYVEGGQVWSNEESAKKAAKLAQLQVQLFRAMAKSWDGSRVPWESESIVKYVVVNSSTGNNYREDTCYKIFNPIAFRTQGDLDSFIASVTRNGITFLLQGMQYEGPALW